jgi:hypothetical protein
VALIRHSDEVLATVLQLSGRHDLVPASSILSLRPALMRAVNAIDAGVHPINEVRVH